MLFVEIEMFTRVLYYYYLYSKTRMYVYGAITFHFTVMFKLYEKWLTYIETFVKVQCLS